MRFRVPEDRNFHNNGPARRANVVHDGEWRADCGALFEVPSPAEADSSSTQGIVQKIIKAAKIQPSDAVYEVGCGTGELTVQLLPQARKVYTIDLEERMVQETRNRAASLGYPNLEVIVGDALRTPLPKRFDVCVPRSRPGLSE
ncbi:Dimethyladenosine transferase, partial [Symbiodinium microadriaticum]